VQRPQERAPRFLAGDTSEVLNEPEQVTQATVVTGKAGAAVADVPHLTGDPEWDALELSETDPTKPLLRIEH